MSDIQTALEVGGQVVGGFTSKAAEIIHDGVIGLAAGVLESIFGGDDSSDSSSDSGNDSSSSNDND